jgi:hypothetical protein
MLKIVHQAFLRDVDFETLPLVKQFFIESPLNRDITAKEKATLINETLRQLGPYIAQYDVDAYIAYRTAITRSADMSNNGAMYLLSGRTRQFNMTFGLKKALPSDIASEVLDFTVHHQRTKLFSKVLNAPQEGVTEYNDMMVHKYALSDNYTTRALSPALVMHQMYDENVAPGATTTKLVDLAPLLVEVGFSFDVKPDKNYIFMKKLYENSQVLAPHLYDQVNNRLRAIYSACYEPLNSKINNHLKNVAGRAGGSLMSAKTPYYDVHYQGHKIGDLGQLNNGRWMLAQYDLKTPMNINSISAQFPHAIKALLPERRVREGLPCSINEVDLPDLVAEKPLLMNNLSVRNPNTKLGGASLLVDKLQLSLNEMPTLVLPGDTLEIINGQVKDPSRQADLILGDIATPSIAGAQAKVPVNISGSPDSPNIKIAGNGEFTHILKIHNDHDPKKKSMIYCEAFGMLASQAVGINTAPIKMLGADVVNESSVSHDQKEVTISRRNPSLVIERFDISHADDISGIRKYNEEIISVAKCDDKAYTGKANDIYGIDIVAETVKAHSTDWSEDRVVLFKSALLNTLIGNIDSHLKNWSMLHTILPDCTKQTRLSPAYDIVAVRCCDASYFNSSGLCQISQGYHTTKEQIVSFGVDLCDMSEKEVLNHFDSVVYQLKAFSEDCKTAHFYQTAFNVTELGEHTLARCLRYVSMTINNIESGIQSDVEIDFKKVFATQMSMDDCNEETSKKIDRIEYRDSQDALEKLNDVNGKLSNWLSDDGFQSPDELFKFKP